MMKILLFAVFGVGLGSHCLAAQPVLCEANVSPSSQGSALQCYKQVRDDVLYQSAVTPYAREYAQSLGISLSNLLAQLNISPIADFSSTDLYHPISSYRYMDGDWTFFWGRGIKAYEILGLAECDKGRPEAVLVLHQDKDWLLSVFRAESSSPYPRKMHTANLTELSKVAQWPLGDMVYTYLAVIEGSIVVVVTHVMTGSGGGPEEGFKFTFDLQDNQLISRKAEPVKMNPGAFKREFNP